MEAYAASKLKLFDRGRPGSIALYSRGDPYQESYIQKNGSPAFIQVTLTATQGLPIGYSLQEVNGKRQISFKQKEDVQQWFVPDALSFLNTPLLLGPLLCAMPWDTKEKIF